MKTYEEISEKYSDEVKKRNRALIFAKDKIERAKARLDYYRQEREKYRQTGDNYSADKARMWNTFYSKIRREKKAVEEAEIEYASLSLGAKGVETLIEKFMPQ